MSFSVELAYNGKANNAIVVIKVINIFNLCFIIAPIY